MGPANVRSWGGRRARWPGLRTPVRCKHSHVGSGGCYRKSRSVGAQGLVAERFRLRCPLDGVGLHGDLRRELDELGVVEERPEALEQTLALSPAPPARPRPTRACGAGPRPPRPAAWRTPPTKARGRRVRV